jgi:integrase/recombinase XerC
VKFSDAIDAFVVDMNGQGRLNSASSERGYRSTLARHGEDVGDRDPRYVGREDVKRTLRRWQHPNTQRTNRSILVSFYDWYMREGYRKDNPADQTQPAKRRPTAVYRLTRDEVVAMFDAARTTRERRAIYLMACAGLRNAEVRGLRGEHFARDGVVWVPSAVAKGQRERWIPVSDELAPVLAEIRTAVAFDEYVLPAQRWRDPPFNRTLEDLKRKQSSSQALRTLVMTLGVRAGIGAHVHPHLLRHAYGDHMTRHAGIRNAQYAMGHAGVATTEIYVGRPTLEELSTSVRGFAYRIADRTNVLGVATILQTALEATTGIEPV